MLISFIIFLLFYLLLFILQIKFSLNLIRLFRLSCVFLFSWARFFSPLLWKFFTARYFLTLRHFLWLFRRINSLLSLFLFSQFTLLNFPWIFRYVHFSFYCFILLGCLLINHSFWLFIGIIFFMRIIRECIGEWLNCFSLSFFKYKIFQAMNEKGSVHTTVNDFIHN
jgi:hypothetical protein